MSKYFAEIGRRGGLKSRRLLDPDTARRMVRIRETRRAARRLRLDETQRLGGTPEDTSAAMQSLQDASWLRMTPAEKLAQLSGLSRLVELLAIEGCRMRHPEEDAERIRYRRAQMRLGLELAARVYGTPRDFAERVS